MSFLYIIVGIKHFVDVEYFVSIVPNYISWKKEAVFISGFFEILLGILLLFHKTRKLAAWGIIMLLIAVFPANIYLYVSEIPRDILNISKIDALIRMPFQAPLILLAFWHSKENHPKWVAYLSSLVFPPTIIYFLST